MRKTLSAAVLASAAVAALVFSGPALATPRLIIGGLTAPGSSQVAIQFTEDRSDPAPARVVIYAPSGYSGTFTAAPNTVLGTVHADVQALAVSPDVVVPADGQIVAADPAANANNPCAPGLHTAVWLLRVTISGQTLSVPVYIDSPVPAGDTLAGTAPFRISFCLSSPYVGTEMGGAPFGAKLLNVRMNLNQGTVRTPTARGSYRWRAVVTPYNVGGALPNAAGMVEARGLVTTPSILTISGRVVNKKKRQVRITGSLRSGTLGVRGATIRLTGSMRKSARTSASGGVTFSLRFKKKGRYSFKLSTTAAAFDVTPQGCATPTAPTLRCVSATAGGFTAASRTLRIRV